MPIGPETAQNIRRNWFSCVQELSDFDLQKRTWLDLTNTNPHWSFLEFVCSYPDKDQLASAHAEGWLTARELELFSELGLAIDEYTAPADDNYDQAAILSDPAWRAFVDKAEQVRQQLLAIVVDVGERNALCDIS